MNKIQKIARKIVANYSIGEQILKFCEEQFKQNYNSLKLDVYEPKIWSQDGSSYDGYLSNTQGDASCDFPINSLDLFDINGCDELFNQAQEDCINSFISDSKTLKNHKYDDLTKEQKRELVDSENCPEQIKEQLENYENEWMSKYDRFLTFEIQFHNKDVTDGDWLIDMYVYVADEYKKHRKYIYNNHVNFNDGDDPKPLIEKQIKDAFKAV